jgi:hypothetical protein
MPLLVPQRPITRITFDERIAVDRRTFPQPRQVAADLVGVRLATPSRERSSLTPPEIGRQRLHARGP